MSRLLLLFSIFTFSSFAFSQTAKTKSDEIKMSVCQPEITQAGRQPSFQFSYRYLVTTDENGAIKEVKELTDNKRFRFLMNDENVVPCIKNWKLKSSERYFVTIFVGTTGVEKFLDVSSKTMKIKIIL